MALTPPEAHGEGGHRGDGLPASSAAPTGTAAAYREVSGDLETPRPERTAPARKRRRVGSFIG